MFSHSEQSWKNVIHKQSFAEVLKIGVLKIFQTSQENTWDSNPLQGCMVEALQHCQKETPTQLFSCEVCEFFENISFYRTPPVVASSDKKSYTRLFTRSEQTFSSQHVSFLKQPIIYGFIDDRNKETLIKNYSRCLYANSRGIV